MFIEDYHTCIQLKEDCILPKGEAIKKDAILHMGRDGERVRIRAKDIDIDIEFEVVSISRNLLTKVGAKYKVVPRHISFKSWYDGLLPEQQQDD